MQNFSEKEKFLQPFDLVWSVISEQIANPLDYDILKMVRNKLLTVFSRRGVL